MESIQNHDLDNQAPFSVLKQRECNFFTGELLLMYNNSLNFSSLIIESLIKYVAKEKEEDFFTVSLSLMDSNFVKHVLSGESMYLIFPVLPETKAFLGNKSR